MRQSQAYWNRGRSKAHARPLCPFKANTSGDSTKGAGPRQSRQWHHECRTAEQNALDPTIPWFCVWLYKLESLRRVEDGSWERESKRPSLEWLFSCSTNICLYRFNEHPWRSDFWHRWFIGPPRSFISCVAPGVTDITPDLKSQGLRREAEIIVVIAFWSWRRFGRMDQNDGNRWLSIVFRILNMNHDHNESIV